MHNSMCCLKLTCLLCACDRDFQSNYRRSTSKITNVSFNKMQFRKVYISNTGRGNGVTGVHRAFSDGYQGESIEHSLMDPKRGRRSTKCTTECAAENLHACFAIASRIIVGVQSRTGKTINVSFNKQSMSVSSKQSMSASGNEEHGVQLCPASIQSIP